MWEHGTSLDNSGYVGYVCNVPFLKIYQICHYSQTKQMTLIKKKNSITAIPHKHICPYNVKYTGVNFFVHNEVFNLSIYI